MGLGGRTAGEIFPIIRLTPQTPEVVCAGQAEALIPTKTKGYFRKTLLW